MTPETKQQIEQIHRGEAPEGYVKPHWGLLLPIGSDTPLATSIPKGKNLGAKSYRF